MKDQIMDAHYKLVNLYRVIHKLPQTDELLQYLEQLDALRDSLDAIQDAYSDMMTNGNN